MTEAGIRAFEQTNLDRRLGVVPAEVAAWKAAANGDMGLHSSQLEALEDMMDELAADQKLELNKVIQAAAGAPFADAFHLLLQKLNGAQDLWRIFHTILVQRRDPRWRPVMDMADLIAADCYSVAMKKVEAWDVRPAQEMRAPPLTFLESSLSPSTASRGESAQNLGFPVRQYRNKMLPIPIVLFPFDQAESIWMMSAIAHEVGHNLDHDLDRQPGKRLSDAVRAKLVGRVSNQTEKQWRRWLQEIFGDVMGVLLIGGGFAVAMASWTVPLGPATSFQTLDEDAVHPPFHLRLLLLVEILKATNAAPLKTIAEELLDIWAKAAKPAWQTPFADESPKLIETVMTEKLAPLNNHSLLELGGNLAFYQGQAQQLADHWLDGTKPQPHPAQPFPFRLVPAAAALAARKLDNPATADIEDLQRKAREYYVLIPKPNMLAGQGTEAKRREYRRGLAKGLFQKATGEEQ
jgi:hypothetical protein